MGDAAVRARVPGANRLPSTRIIAEAVPREPPRAPPMDETNHHAGADEECAPSA